MREKTALYIICISIPVRYDWNCKIVAPLLAAAYFNSSKVRLEHFRVNVSQFEGKNISIPVRYDWNMVKYLSPYTCFKFQFQ